MSGYSLHLWEVCILGTKKHRLRHIIYQQWHNWGGVTEAVALGTDFRGDLWGEEGRRKPLPHICSYHHCPTFVIAWCSINQKLACARQLPQASSHITPLYISFHSNCHKRIYFYNWIPIYENLVSWGSGKGKYVI